MGLFTVAPALFPELHCTYKIDIFLFPLLSETYHLTPTINPAINLTNSKQHCLTHSY